MKRLYLIRHAKSSWADSNQTDFDRPLNQRGNTQAPEMARRLSAEINSDLTLLSSSARRTRETSAYLETAFAAHAVSIRFEDQLYLAPVRMLLQVIQETDPALDQLVLVGHNPGMSELASLLADEPVNMVTSHVIGLQLHVEDWEAVVQGTGSIVYFDFPKKTADP